MKTAAVRDAILRMQRLIRLALLVRVEVGGLPKKEVDGLTLSADPVVLLFDA